MKPSSLSVAVRRFAQAPDRRFIARLFAALIGRPATMEEIDMLGRPVEGQRQVQLTLQHGVRPITPAQAGGAALSVLCLGNDPEQELKHVAPCELAPILVLAHIQPASECGSVLHEFEENVLEGRAIHCVWLDLSDPAENDVAHPTWPAELLPATLEVISASSKGASHVGFFEASMLKGHISGGDPGSRNVGAQTGARVLILDEPWCFEPKRSANTPKFKVPGQTDAGNHLERLRSMVSRREGASLPPLFVDTKGADKGAVHSALKEVIGTTGVTWLTQTAVKPILPSILLSEKQRAAVASELKRFSELGHGDAADESRQDASAAARRLLGGLQACHRMRRSQTADEHAKSLADIADAELRRLDEALQRHLREAIDVHQLAAVVLRDLHGKGVLSQRDVNRAPLFIRLFAQEKEIEPSADTLDVLSRRIHWLMKGMALAHVTLMQLYWSRFLVPRLHGRLQSLTSGGHAAIQSFHPQIESIRALDELAIRDHLKDIKPQRIPVRLHWKKIVGPLKVLPRTLGKMLLYSGAVLGALGIIRSESPLNWNDLATFSNRLMSEDAAWPYRLAALAAVAFVVLYVLYKTYGGVHAIHVERLSKRKALREELLQTVQGRLKDIAETCKQFMADERALFLTRLREEFKGRLDRPVSSANEASSVSAKAIESGLKSLEQFGAQRQGSEKQRQKGRAEAAKAVVEVLKPWLKETVIERID